MRREEMRIPAVSSTGSVRGAADEGVPVSGLSADAPELAGALSVACGVVAVVDPCGALLEAAGDAAAGVLVAGAETLAAGAGSFAAGAFAAGLGAIAGASKSRGAGAAGADAAAGVAFRFSTDRSAAGDGVSLEAGRTAGS